MEFNDFFSSIQQGRKKFDYSGYSDLLFCFDPKSKHPASFINLDTQKKSYEYSGVYITGYSLDSETTDLAIAAAIIMGAEKIPFADKELKNSLSLSKISEAAKLVSNKVPVPKTYGGTKMSIVRAITTGIIALDFPLVLKRANGRKGQDNLTIYDKNEIYDYLQEKEDGSIWVLQKMVPSNGFYRLNCYFGKSAYGIFRSLDDKPEDLERHKAHMYKPAGGSNAHFLEPREIPLNLRALAQKATKVIGRDFAGVDIIVDKKTRKPLILEVNYFPQLVTVESFKERRIQGFLDGMEKLMK